ncbi:MAG: prolipoprotein diacylglyceryl transferase [Acidimicrobiales bacterium]
MRPIPVAFHIGPLIVHTYGIGLAITFWFGYRYFERRLRKAGYPWQWFTGVFVWLVVSAVVGARVMHVIANLSFYTAQPGQILQVWHGGLSSFGGLLFAVPTGIILLKKRCPELKVMPALDLIAPVLVAAWALGRLLGPQLMVAGGGHPTSQWFGMYYADQVGKRLPVPIFQAIDYFVIFGILLLIERRYSRRPTGFVLAAATSLWGLARFYEERLWLAEPGHLGAELVELAGLAMFFGGGIVMLVLWRRQRTAGAVEGNDRGHHAGIGSLDPAQILRDAPAAGRPGPGGPANA